MSIKVELQNPRRFANVPPLKAFKIWVRAVFEAENEQGLVCVRIVDEEESRTLNQTYRNKNKSTNVLAFPYHSEDIIGDLVICAPVMTREAQAQDKDLNAHWAHLVVHGCLHCLGYDHMEEQERQEMEAMEIRILTNLGYANPYAEV